MYRACLGKFWGEYAHYFLRFRRGKNVSIKSKFEFFKKGLKRQQKQKLCGFICHFLTNTQVGYSLLEMESVARNVFSILARPKKNKSKERGILNDYPKRLPLIQRPKK